ncbi:DUF302 domain-containing protein [Capnocytophaga sp. 051621]|uniref:DUF302 domain-containing protein n=2 Tax=Capnocytophaga TaxID=1016 RepID=A0ABS1YS41_9FLAO|nr:MULTISPECIES: DUF302 domain-containing protein [Capnocytophaga]MBI1645456.1 DUF302 domain-containing protein [Capnocytophaga periodontitidis]MBM0649210.1 DUF302 domain-containing protein [Capnocytophaga genosp. AHN8471]MBM0659846.1 DUF302 domain-containing protein [Capnocytophaga genosp. AHN8471]MBM0661444.1 DUF302 domain-containing protein [Capnocytophaga genosp. AHN8471]
MALKLQIMLFLLFPLLGMAQINSTELKTTTEYMVQSPYTFTQTIERLQEILKSKGITVFATIDHQAAAKAVGEKLAPATVLIVGNPKIGTALMQENPRFAIELPLKILIYEENKTVNIRYEKIAAIAEKYHIKQNFATAEKIDTAMLQLIKSSISK